MKKLPLKKDFTPSRRTIAENLANELREKLKEHIAILMPKLYEALGWETPNFEEEEEWAICTGDLENPIYIKVVVDNSYLDVEDTCYEDMEVAEIISALDGDVVVRNEDGDEWTSADLTLDELVNIAKVLEESYWKMSK